MKLKLVLFLLIAPLMLFGQLSKTHYIPPLTSSTNVVPQEQYIHISTPTTYNVIVKIIELGGTTYNYTVSKNNPREHFIGTNYTQLQINKTSTGNILNNKGYIIEADEMIFVSIRVFAGGYNQAGALVSKGLAGLGTQFRVGAFVNNGFSGFPTTMNHLTFFSVLATEDNTSININHKAGLTFANPILTSFTLNRGQSYVAAVDGNTTINKNGLIGAFISSNKPIAFNCGSFGGTNGTSNGSIDLGFDQIVSYENTGNEYIFIKGNGGSTNTIERPLIVAHEDNTLVTIYGNTTTSITLNSGEYLAIDGTEYHTINNNLYVSSSKNVFAFQSIGGTNSMANQEMFFVPPLSCDTSKIIENIPTIQYIGSYNTSRLFTGSLSLITEVGALLEIGVNGTLYVLNNLPSGVSYIGPNDVNGNNKFKTYTFTGLAGNISVKSTKQVYLSYFGSNSNATYGGFYSGFSTKPQVVFNDILLQNSKCIPNVELNVDSSFNPLENTFQWFFNGIPIDAINGGAEPTLNPTNFGPGYYKVLVENISCGNSQMSNDIPVSICTPDFDSDGINDNIDIDYDGDGIINCNESFGSTAIDFSNPIGGTIFNNSYSNSFTGTSSTVGVASLNPVQGFTDGSIITEVPKDKNEVTYLAGFSNPISIQIEYPESTLIVGDFLTSDEEFIIKVPVDKTITVLDPLGQLRIDTDYDGNYKQGVGEFTSFEIRFKLNSLTPLALGSGKFQFRTHLTDSISITHRNLSDTNNNKAIFKITATCVPYDSDGDGHFDYADIDSDNDGIPDEIEAHGRNFRAKSGIDLNKDGLDDAFVNLIPANSDGDKNLNNEEIPDYLDLDSDNDGIYDLVESGHTALDADNNGIVDGIPSNFGKNGLLNSLETFADSFVIKYAVLDTDLDKIWNFVDWDSDNDNCPDVIEAGFSDPNNDYFLGDIPITVNQKGIVTSGVGYTAPLPNYLISAPIIINLQPINTPVCELGTTNLSIQTNTIDSYEWKLSTDNGVNWNSLIDDATYSGVTTNNLQISNATLGMNGYQYRVFLNKNGNTCGLYSDAVILTVNPLPIISDTKLHQCDDGDTVIGWTYFNLTEANPFISANYATDTFTYYKTKLAAETDDISLKIENPIAYFANSQTVWARIVSNKGCFKDVTKIDLTVSTTDILIGFPVKTFFQCDDFDGANGSDFDGFSTFNFSSVTTDLLALSPGNPITISYYRNLADALAKIDAIPNPSNYRNSDFKGNSYRDSQDIYIRIDSNIDNDCLGLGHYITLTVNPVPIANPVNNLVLCDDISDGNDANGIVQYFNLGSQSATILGSQSATNFDLTYHASLADANSGANPLPLIYTNTTRDRQTIYVRIVNNTTRCVNPHLTFDLIVNPLPIIKTPTPLPLCDDLNDSDNRNGIVQSFNLNSRNAEILNGLSPTQFLVTYHKTLTDADNGNALASPYTNANSGGETLIVKVTNNVTGCYNTKERLQLIVNPLPVINAIPDLELCDNPSDGNDANGFVQSFNLESQTPIILGNQLGNLKVTYHRTQIDANRGDNPLASPFTNEIKDQQPIFIRILNLTTGCFIADTNFKIIVKQKPVFEIDTEQIICLNLLPYRLFIKSALENYNYSWFDANGFLIASNTSAINITKGGKYTIVTTNSIGCSRSIDINIKESIIAKITLDNITIVDNSSNNSITINNANQEIGIGDYEYSLDSDFGSYQDNPIFEQVTAGVRTLFIRDKNNCGIAPIEIPIIGNPGFLTPNGDGYNDTWQIQGIRLYPKSQIYIFDRYGKVVATINPTGNGWDGTYKGKQVDSGEYWFSAQLDNGRVIKGHFSLIRR